MKLALQRMRTIKITSQLMLKLVWHIAQIMNLSVMFASVLNINLCWYIF